MNYDDIIKLMESSGVSLTPEQLDNLRRNYENSRTPTEEARLNDVFAQGTAPRQPAQSEAEMDAMLANMSASQPAPAEPVAPAPVEVTPVTAEQAPISFDSAPAPVEAAPVVEAPAAPVENNSITPNEGVEATPEVVENNDSKITELENELQDLTASYYANEISSEQFTERKDDLERQIAEAKMSNNKEMPEEQIDPRVKELEDQLQDLTASYYANEMSSEEFTRRKDELERLIAEAKNTRNNVKVVENIDSEVKALEDQLQDLTASYYANEISSEEFTRRKDEIETMIGKAKMAAEKNEAPIVQNTEVTEEGKELFNGEIGEGMPTPEQQFKNATGIDFDPNIHEIIYDGAMDDGYDNTITPFKIVEKVKKVEAPVESEPKAEPEVAAMAAPVTPPPAAPQPAVVEAPVEVEPAEEVKKAEDVVEEKEEEKTEEKEDKKEEEQKEENNTIYTNDSPGYNIQVGRASGSAKKVVNRRLNVNKKLFKVCAIGGLAVGIIPGFGVALPAAMAVALGSGAFASLTADVSKINMGIGMRHVLNSVAKCYGVEVGYSYNENNPKVNFIVRNEDGITVIDTLEKLERRKIQMLKKDQVPENKINSELRKANRLVGVLNYYTGNKLDKNVSNLAPLFDRFGGVAPKKGYFAQLINNAGDLLEEKGNMFKKLKENASRLNLTDTQVRILDENINKVSEMKEKVNEKSKFSKKVEDLNNLKTKVIETAKNAARKAVAMPGNIANKMDELEDKFIEHLNSKNEEEFEENEKIEFEENEHPLTEDQNIEEEYAPETREAEEEIPTNEQSEEASTPEEPKQEQTSVEDILMSEDLTDDKSEEINLGNTNSKLDIDKIDEGLTDFADKVASEGMPNANPNPAPVSKADEMPNVNPNPEVTTVSAGIPNVNANPDTIIRYTGIPNTNVNPEPVIKADEIPNTNADTTEMEKQIMNAEIQNALESGDMALHDKLVEDFYNRYPEEKPAQENGYRMGM